MPQQTGVTGVTGGRPRHRARHRARIRSAIGAVLAVLTSRLSRIIDRAGARGGARGRRGGMTVLLQDELAMLSQRAMLIHRAITLCILAAVLVCSTVVTLFLARSSRSTSR